MSCHELCRLQSSIQSSIRSSHLSTRRLILSSTLRSAETWMVKGAINLISLLFGYGLALLGSCLDSFLCWSWAIRVLLRNQLVRTAGWNPAAGGLLIQHCGKSSYYHQIFREQLPQLADSWYRSEMRAVRRDVLAWEGLAHTEVVMPRFSKILGHQRRLPFDLASNS